jgi:hypothetical protein
MRVLTLWSYFAREANIQGQGSSCTAGDKEVQWVDGIGELYVGGGEITLTKLTS